MQNKLGFVASGTTIALAVSSVITSFIDVKMPSTVLAALTLISACVAFTLWALATKQNSTTSEKRVAQKPSTMHKDSIAGAVEHKRSSDNDETVNKQSATSTGVSIENNHFDEESGLLSKSFFPVYLEQRITAARRTLRPVSLVIFELDGLDKNDSGPSSDRDFYISAVGDVVKRTLRESDCAFRVDENIFAAVMDDTTESGAVWAAERVRGVLHTGALAGRVTVSAGVACYPSHCLEPSDLIDSATKALSAAKARGVDQVEIAAEQ